jgi:hypothetical protein
MTLGVSVSATNKGEKVKNKFDRFFAPTWGCHELEAVGLKVAFSPFGKGSVYTLIETTMIVSVFSSILFVYIHMTMFVIDTYRTQTIVLCTF